LLKHYLALARPHQYTKNGFIFLPAYFGHSLADPGVFLSILIAFACFCMASSAVYVFNDLRDLEYDRLHPVKKFRPLASGAVTPAHGKVMIAILLVASIGLSALLLPLEFLAVVGAYLMLNFLYSMGLKHTAVLDVVIVSLGFVLRIFAGAEASGIEPSHWLVLMTFLLALFLSLAKRRDDLLLLAKNGNATRKSLDGYNLQFVSMSMVFMAAVTLVSYILYTVAPENMIKHRSPYLYLTSIWVVLGLLRYMQIAFVEENSGSPSRVILKDRFLQIVLLGWLASFFVLFYVPGN
jgi:decaprenyl-phosphate phosphoribosyltransferase